MKESKDTERPSSWKSRGYGKGRESVLRYKGKDLALLHYELEQESVECSSSGSL